MDAKPVRIQRKRTKGFNLQAASPNGLPVVYVGRPTKWGNPFNWKFDGRDDLSRLAIGIPEETRKAVSKALFSDWIKCKEQKWMRRLAVKELRGKNLCCWCNPGQPCHADILLEIANAD